MKKDKKRILFINYEFPPLGGGGGHANQQIAHEMALLGHEIYILTSSFRDLPQVETVTANCHVIRIPTLRRHAEKCTVFEMFVFLISSLVFVPWHFSRIRPDHVICFFSIPSGPAGLMLRYIFNCPFGVALRGGDVPGFLPEKLAGFHRLTNWLTRWIWKKASFVTANSLGLKELAQQFMPQKNVHVVPNGVDERFFHNRLEQIRSDGSLKCLTVGRLNEQKKIHRLIDVFSRLQHLNPNITLEIIGDGPERKALQTQAQNARILDRTVFFRGWIQRQNLIQNYKNADVLLLSSDYEGMPNVVLEAMASSLAIVATEAPGTVELVHSDQNGYLIDKNQLQDFDAKLTELALNQDKLRELQHQSLCRASKYSWKTVSLQYLNLLQN